MRHREAGARRALLPGSLFSRRQIRLSSLPAAAPDSLLRYPPFVLFWFARVANIAAHQMLAVAVGWQIYELTNSALDLGLVGLAQFLPSLALVLVVGHVADRYNRRRILQACQAVEAISATALAVLSATGNITEFAIFGLIAVVGAGRAFQMPTQQALLPGLVPLPMLSRALAASASATQAAAIGGPVLGGLIYVAGPAYAYGSSAALFVVAAVLVGLMRGGQKPGAREPATMASVFAGMTFIRSRPTLLGAISLDLFAVLLGGATALLPIFARDILHTGPWGLGLLRASTAIGALTMAVYLAHHPLRGRAGRKMFAAVAVFGLATIVFGVSTWFPLSSVALMVLGASDMISVVIRQTLVQIGTPDPMRGRVSAVNSVFIGASNQLGEFESGATAALLGPVGSVLLGGIGALAVVALWAKRFPALLGRDRLASAPK